nr:sodium-independent anion transporter [Agromyces bauzanensis]
MLERVGVIRDVEVVIIRMSQLQILDATGAQVINELIQALERRGVTVLVKGSRPATCSCSPTSAPSPRCGTRTTSSTTCRRPSSTPEATSCAGR